MIHVCVKTRARVRVGHWCIVGTRTFISGGWVGGLRESVGKRKQQTIQLYLHLSLLFCADWFVGATDGQPSVIVV